LVYEWAGWKAAWRAASWVALKVDVRVVEKVVLWAAM